MSEPTAFNPQEPDEVAAPAVIIYTGTVIAWLFAALAWVFYFRGYA